VIRCVAIAQFCATFAVRWRNFEQWVLFYFLCDELVQFEMRHLQQLNRLHQLRSHHKRLGLSQEKAGG